MSDELLAAARATLAAALRFQAMALRSQAELLSSQASTLERQADGIEDGSVQVPTRPVRLEVVEEEPGEGSAAAVESLLLTGDTSGPLRWTAPGGEMLSEQMLEWLTLFDARVTSPLAGRPFIEAVNMAAAEAMPLDDKTAAWVAERARELREREERG